MKYTILYLLFLVLINFIKVNAQDSTFIYPSRANLELDLSAEVLFTSLNLKFLYSVTNKESSSQDLEEFYLVFDAAINQLISPVNWSSLKANNRKKFIIWGSKSREFDLLPGSSLDGFSFETSGLPAINNYYAVGYVDEPVFEFGNAPANNQVQGTDIFENSVNGFTIGPWLPDSSLSSEAFIDTLETFRFRSCEELDWVTDATVCGQLENNLSQVKTALVNEDSLTAANALKTFIDLVEAEKDASLTSEGYALLYFNAQYLAERLPEPEIGDGKVALCHKPGTPAEKTMNLPPQAVKGHLGHGDTLGVCSNNQEDQP